MADHEVYGATWHAATAVMRGERPRLTFDLDVDACVIGGGLAGLTAARELARRGWSVALIEAQRLAWSASSRTLGIVTPGFSQSIDKIVDRVGLDHARALWRLSERGVDYVREAAAAIGMTPVDGCLDVGFAEDEDAIRECARLLAEIGVEAELWPAERLRTRLPGARYAAAINHPSAFHLHPLNYVFGLAAAAEEAGVRIFEHTPALSIDPAGVRKRIATPQARLRAAQVVLAGGAQLGALMPQVAATLLPVTRGTVTTAPLGDALNEAIAYAGGVCDSAGNSYRIVDGGRLQWCGATTTWAADPRRLARRLTRDIARLYPRIGRVEIEHAGAGTDGVPVHRMPQIGELAPGLWLATGFGSQGLNTTAMAGELIARAIIDNDQDWRLFLPFELVWAGGAMGRVVVQGMAVGGRLGRAAEKVARAFVRRPTLPAQDAATEIAPAADEPQDAPVAEPKKPRKARGEGRRAKKATERAAEMATETPTENGAEQPPERPAGPAAESVAGNGAAPPLQDDDRSKASAQAPA